MVFSGECYYLITFSNKCLSLLPVVFGFDCCFKIIFSNEYWCLLIISLITLKIIILLFK